MNYLTKQVYEYISQETNDPIVEWKTCKVSGKEFAIYKSDLEFYDKISPKFETSKEIGDKLIEQKPEYFSRTKEGKLKVKISIPNLCPEERQRRRLMFRNERKLYCRKCDATGENIVSIYSPDKQYKVYKQDYRWSDKRNPLNYGFEFNFNKNIFEQFKYLFYNVPKISLDSHSSNENCPYVNYIVNSKNCYMTVAGGNNENCHYCNTVVGNIDCIDCDFSFDSDNCYSCFGIYGCRKTYFSAYAGNNNNCYFLEDCDFCENCFACIGLKHKKNYIFNKQYDKNTSDIVVKKFLSGDRNLLSQIKKFFINYPHKDRNLFMAENCVGGNNISRSKNCIECYNINELEDSTYCCNFGRGSSNCFDSDYGGFNISQAYQVITLSMNLNKIYFCSTVRDNSSNLFYSTNMSNSKFCFLCDGLRNKEYCIFNKQYSKEEWNNLVPQIINKMIDEGTRGEFFDPSISPFGYNETVAQEYFSLTKQEAIAKGYKRQDNNYDPKIPENTKVIKRQDYTEEERERLKYEEGIENKIFICEKSGRPFRLIKQEIEFYKKHNLPLPSKHPDIRHQERLKQRPPRELNLRKCDKCGKQILSVYDSNFEGKVYCEECYNKEIYG